MNHVTNLLDHLCLDFPDTAYTESLIDGMEEGRAEDDKTMFDFYFVEAMKALGLESELMEADSLINPEAEEIDPEDLAASADYFDNLSENDDVLDEMLDEDVPLGIAPPFAIGDLVYRRFDDKKAPMKVVKMRKMFASPLHAVTVVGTSGGDELEYDETQLVKLMSPEEKANTFVREEVEGEVQTENKLLKASNTLEDALNKVVDDLTDEQIDKFTEMILDLRDKVKSGLNEEEGETDVKTIDKLLPKINTKKEYIELLPKLIGLDIPGVTGQAKKAMLLKIAKQLK